MQSARHRPLRRIDPMAAACALVATLVCGCATQAAGPSDSSPRSLRVVASAYNSLPAQTDSQPSVAAWGDRLKPGLKAIAVSRDLLKLGLRRGTVVRIEGLPGSYRVMDKMSARWKRKIDIYMGVDRRAAIDWGVRPVTIHWAPGSGP